jgi:hypothetical protein
MANNKFKAGDLVKLCSNVSSIEGKRNSNTNADLLKGKKLIVDHYMDTISDPKSVNVVIYGEGPSLYTCLEDQLELFSN